MENKSIEVNEVEEFNEEEAKAEIKTIVIDELKMAGHRILTEDFTYKEELTHILDKYEKALEDYNNYCKDVKDKYLEHVAETMIKCERESLEDKKASLISDIEKIEAFDRESKYRKIEELRTDKNYKVARDEALQMLNYLKGIDIEDVSLIQELVGPLVNHFDFTSLKVASAMLGGEKKVAGRQIGMMAENLMAQVNSIQQENHLARDLKKYIQNPKDDFIVFKLRY